MGVRDLAATPGGVLLRQLPYGARQDVALQRRQGEQVGFPVQRGTGRPAQLQLVEGGGPGPPPPERPGHKDGMAAQGGQVGEEGGEAVVRRDAHHNGLPA